MAKSPEVENAIQAFNAVIRLWGVRQVVQYQGKGAPDLELLAQHRQIRLVKVNGTLNDLLLPDSPALLAVRLPGVGGKRYLAVTGLSGNQVTVTPALEGRATLSRDELVTLWSGEGYIPWRNYQNIPDISTPESSGVPVTRLQRLLAVAGLYPGSPTGRFDRETIAAVERFQKRSGIPVNGVVGGDTLLLLYRAGKFNVPRLTVKSAGGATL